LFLLPGDERHVIKKILAKHCVDYGSAETGGFTIAELERYGRAILEDGKKNFDRRKRRRTITWVSPHGVVFKIGTFIVGRGKNSREIINMIYTNPGKQAPSELTQKMASPGEHVRETPTSFPVNAVPISTTEAVLSSRKPTRANQAFPDPGVNSEDTTRRADGSSGMRWTTCPRRYRSPCDGGGCALPEGARAPLRQGVETERFPG